MAQGMVAPGLIPQDISNVAYALGLLGVQGTRVWEVLTAQVRPSVGSESGEGTHTLPVHTRAFGVGWRAPACMTLLVQWHVESRGVQCTH